MYLLLATHGHPAHSDNLLLPGEVGQPKPAPGEAAGAQLPPCPAHTRSPGPTRPQTPGLPDLPPSALRPARVLGRVPASHPSPVEGELLPAAAVAVATLPGCTGLRHLRDGPTAPNKDGGYVASGAEPGAELTRLRVQGSGLLCSLTKQLGPREAS